MTLFQPNFLWLFSVTVLTKLTRGTLKYQFFFKKKRLKFNIVASWKISKRYYSNSYDCFSANLFLNHHVKSSQKLPIGVLKNFFFENIEIFINTGSYDSEYIKALLLQQLWLYFNRTFFLNVPCDCTDKRELLGFWNFIFHFFSSAWLCQQI